MPFDPVDLRTFDKYYSDILTIDVFYTRHREHGGQLETKVEIENEMIGSFGFGVSHMIRIDPEVRIMCSCKAHILTKIPALRLWHHWRTERNTLPLDVERRPEPETIRTPRRRITLE